MKHYLIALTCLAALSSSHLAQASQTDKDATSRAVTGTACQDVKGGKIIGHPGPRSKFKNLRLGMSQHVVQRQIGNPDDYDHHPTGKAFAPFYQGPDRWRSRHYYKGSGILVFRSDNTLIEIHHDARESGDRSLR